MFSSTNENAGFSAIGQEDLEKVNGGFIPGVTEFGTAVIILGTIAAVTYCISKATK